MLYKASATPRSAAPGPALGAEPGSVRGSRDGGLPGGEQTPAASQEEVQPQRLQQPQHAAGPARQLQHEEEPAAGPSHVAPAPARPAAAAKPAGSRLPAPPARASRLRPPTTSSGYFSTAATNRTRCGWGAGVGQHLGHAVRQGTRHPRGHRLLAFPLNITGPSHLCSVQDSATTSRGRSCHGTASNRRQQASSRRTASSSWCRRPASGQACGAARRSTSRQAACPEPCGPEQLTHPHPLQAQRGRSWAACRPAAAQHSGHGGSATAGSPRSQRSRCQHAFGKPRACPAHGVPSCCGCSRQPPCRQHDAQHCPPAVAGAEPGAGVWRRRQAGGQPGARRGRGAAQADGRGAAHHGVGGAPVRGCFAAQGTNPAGAPVPCRGRLPRRFLSSTVRPH